MSNQTYFQNLLYARDNIQYDFSRILETRELDDFFPVIAKQLIEKNKKEIIEKINGFVQNTSSSHKNQKELDDNQIQFTRQMAFTTLLMMYQNVFQKQNNHNRQSGFYQINMEQIKQNNTIQAQQKLKCIHSYFINFYKRFLGEEIKYKLIEEEVKQLEHQRDKLNNKIQQLNDYLTKLKTNYRNNLKDQKNDQQENEEIIEFIRRIDHRYLDDTFIGDSCKIQLNLGKCEIIENSILVNFADRNVGGLSLDDHNIAQEEILMLTHPEALIGMLFMKPMEDNEAILIKNVIRFNDYDGYESTFRQKVEKYFYISGKIDNMKPIKNDILCMDALCYHDRKQQFDDIKIKRELKKSYVAFSLALDQSEKKSISTGKWGCGIFNGDPELKFLIQWLTFSKAYQENLKRKKESYKYINNQRNQNQNTQNFQQRMNDQVIQNQSQIDQQSDKVLVFSSFNDEKCQVLVSKYQNLIENLQIIKQFIKDLQQKNWKQTQRF